MSYYALTDSDWSWDDEAEGRAIVVCADTPQEAVKLATEKHIADFPGAGGICWKVARLWNVGFEMVDWEDDNKPTYSGFDYYPEGSNGPLDTPSPQPNVLPPVVTGQMEIGPDVTAADMGVNTEPAEDDIGPYEQALRDAVEPFLDWLEQREEGAHIKEVREGLIGVEDVIPDDHVVLGAHPRGHKDQGVLTVGHFRRLQAAYDGKAAPAPQPNLRVKPLEWKAVNEGFGHGRMHYGTGAFGHWYGVKREKAGLWSCVHHVGGTPVYLPPQVSLDEAKSAAQADYDERLSAALDTPSPQARVSGPDTGKPSPEERVKELEAELEEARSVINAYSYDLHISGGD
jgi:hypothetical protein